MDARPRIASRLDEICHAFTKARLEPSDAARLLDGLPFTFSPLDSDLAGYAWHAHAPGEWSVQDSSGRVCARLYAPEAPSKPWTFDVTPHKQEKQEK